MLKVKNIYISVPHGSLRWVLVGVMSQHHIVLNSGICKLHIYTILLQQMNTVMEHSNNNKICVYTCLDV